MSDVNLNYSQTTQYTPSTHEPDAGKTEAKKGKPGHVPHETGKKGEHTQVTNKTTTETETTEHVKSKLTTPYDGVDSKSSAKGAHHVNFDAKTTVIGSAKAPVLSAPNENGIPERTPLKAPGQTIVANTFIKNVTEELQKQGVSAGDIAKIVQNLTTPNASPILGPDGKVDVKLMALANSVNATATAATQKECGLPTTWNMKSTDASSWTPLPLTPYGAEKQTEINNFFKETMKTLGEEYVKTALAATPPTMTKAEAELMLTALKTGTPDPTIATKFGMIQEQATVMTQQEFSLPTNWSVGTTDPLALTPTGIGPLNHINVAVETTRQTIKNLETMLNTIGQTITKGMEEAGPTDPVAKANYLATLDFMKIISDCLGAAKKMLEQIEADKTRQQQKAMAGKEDQTKSLQSASARQAAIQESAAAKQNSMAALGLSMNIIGPILSAIIGVALTIIGVIIAVVTVGIGTPALIALLCIGFALTAATTAFSILDSQVHVTSWAAGVFDQMIDAIMPGAPDWAKWIVKGAIIGVFAAVAVVILVLLVLSGSGISTIGNMSVQIVVKAVQQALMQLVMMILMTVVASTNCTAKLVGSIMKANGCSDHDIMIAEAVIGAVVMGALMLATVLITGGKEMKETVEDIADSVKSLTSKGLAKIIEETTQEVMDSINNALEILDDFEGSQAQAFKEALMHVMPFFKDTGGWQKAAALGNLGAEIGQGAVGLSNNIASLAISAKMYQIAIENGDSKVAVTFLKEMIKMMEKLLKALQSGTSDTADALQSLGETMKHIMSSLNQSMMNLGGSHIPAGSA